MKDALLKQVESDLFRAKEALDSAERNVKNHQSKTGGM